MRTGIIVLIFSPNLQLHSSIWNISNAELTIYCTVRMFNLSGKFFRIFLFYMSKTEMNKIHGMCEYFAKIFRVLELSCAVRSVERWAPNVAGVKGERRGDRERQEWREERLHSATLLPILLTHICRPRREGGWWKGALPCSFLDPQTSNNPTLIEGCARSSWSSSSCSTFWNGMSSKLLWSFWFCISSGRI